MRYESENRQLTTTLLLQVSLVWTGPGKTITTFTSVTNNLMEVEGDKRNTHDTKQSIVSYCSTTELKMTKVSNKQSED